MKRNKLTNGLVTKVITSIILILVVSCDKNQEEDWIINSGKCIFIDHHINTHGELIEGNYIEGPQVDFPTYTFNAQNKILSGDINFSISKSLKIIYGNGISLSGLAGGGAGTGLTGIYELPYEQGAFKIIDVESNGTVHIMYNDSLIVLNIDEEWINITSRIDTQDFGEGIAKANLITADKFVNYGIIEKSDIEKWGEN
jgi:hypothetical protein